MQRKEFDFYAYHKELRPVMAQNIKGELKCYFDRRINQFLLLNKPPSLILPTLKNNAVGPFEFEISILFQFFFESRANFLDKNWSKGLF